jgi:hypothetical protein
MDESLLQHADPWWATQSVKGAPKWWVLTDMRFKMFEVAERGVWGRIAPYGLQTLVAILVSKG